MERFSSSDWLVESLRLTLFLAPEPVDASAWWTDVTGEPPAETATKKMGGELLFAGPYNGGALNLVVTPMRVDWTFGAAEVPGDALPLTVPTVGSLDVVLPLFARLGERWFASAKPRATRLALGAVLLHQEKTSGDATERLQAFLPVSLAAGPVSDFLFQINRKVQSGTIGGMELNRLSKWSRVRFRAMAFQVTPTEQGGALTAAQMPIGDASYFVRLESDVNTAAEYVGPIKPEQLIGVLGELVASTRQLATDGVS